MKVVKYFALIICLIVLSLFLFSCDGAVIHEGSITFNSLTVDGNNVYGEVANEVTTFSFLNEIETRGNADYTVSLDIYGQEIVTTKTVALYEGENTFYVLETVGNQNKLYTVSIRRIPVYSVIFDTNGDTYIEPQSIEEGGYLSTPSTPVRIGYTFAGWTYNFSNPVTSDLTIKATWAANSYTITYDPDCDGINEDLVVTYGNIYFLETPVKEGYIFEGWYSGNKEYTSGIWNETNNVTLTAKWDAELGGDFMPATGTAYILHPVKIHEEAKESSSTVGTAAWGSAVQLIERNTLWTKIQFTDASSYKKFEGYIRNELLTPDKRLVTLVTLETPVTAKISGLGTKEDGTPFTLNVRTTPWDSSHSIEYTNINILDNIKNEKYQIKDGDKVEKLGATENGSWVYIRFTKFVNGVEKVEYGWCMAKYVRVV